MPLLTLCDSSTGSHMHTNAHNTHPSHTCGLRRCAVSLSRRMPPGVYAMQVLRVLGAATLAQAVPVGPLTHWHTGLGMVIWSPPDPPPRPPPSSHEREA